jgi:hypothetical protein
MNQCRISNGKARIILMEKIKASESLSRHALWVPLKIQSSPKCKARKKFRCAAYDLYVSKKVFPQRSITSHLVAVFWRLSGMAITNDLPSVFCWVSQMASSHISSFISWDEIWDL